MTKEGNVNVITTTLIWMPGSCAQIFIHGGGMDGPKDGWSYLRSVWLGFTGIPLNYPSAIWQLIGKSDFFKAVLGLTSIMLFAFPYFGLRGKLYALDVSTEDALTLHKLGF